MRQELIVKLIDAMRNVVFFDGEGGLTWKHVKQQIIDYCREDEEKQAILEEFIVWFDGEIS